MDKVRTLDIEIALLRVLNFRQNIVVPNVQFGIRRYLSERNGLEMRDYDELHECDILKVTPSGYATEYEIKVSKGDFMADKKKKHKHGSRFISMFYYVVPDYLFDFAKNNLPNGCGLGCYSKGDVRFVVEAEYRKDCFKWTDEEMFKLARLGTMRIYGLKKNIIKLLSNER